MRTVPGTVMSTVHLLVWASPHCITKRTMAERFRWKAPSQLLQLGVRLRIEASLVPDTVANVSRLVSHTDPLSHWWRVTFHQYVMIQWPVAALHWDLGLHRYGSMEYLTLSRRCKCSSIRCMRCSMRGGRIDRRHRGRRRVPPVEPPRRRPPGRPPAGPVRQASGEAPGSWTAAAEADQDTADAHHGRSSAAAWTQ